MRISVVVAIVSAAVWTGMPGAAFADSPAGSAQTAAQPRSSDLDRITCKDRVQTGSRLAYARDCHTQREWNEITRAGRAFVLQEQEKALEAPPRMP